MCDTLVALAASTARRATLFAKNSDRERNEASDGADADISAEGAAARTLVVHVREDLEAARQVRELLA